MCDSNDNRDDYGFERYQHNEDGSLSFNTPNVSPKNFIIIIVVVVLLVCAIIYVLMSGVAGYYSWNEFPSDATSNKLVKTVAAIIFSPAYILYTTVKLSFFGRGG